ncbi:MAG: hypothetical protein HPY83_18705 [Anaerolineae bacterium]|nr:hypothetical protein [Anaerolineae bacterium]
MSALRRPRHSISRLPVLLLAAVAFGLRVYRLAAQSLSYDEAVSAYLTRIPVGDMLSWTAADVQPPLYYLLLRFWTDLAGTSEYSLRFLSVGLSLLAVPLLYRLALCLITNGESGRRGWGAACVAALAAAIHPWHVWHAQDARMYSLLLAAGAFSTLLLLRWFAFEGRVRYRVWAPLALSYALLLYTHYLSAGLLAAHVVLASWWAWRRGDVRALGSYLARTVLPALLAFIPWVPAALHTVGSDASYWPGAIKAGEAARKVAVALFVGGPGETVLEAAGLRVSVAMLLVLGLALATHRPQPAAWVLELTAATAAATGTAFLLIPKFNPRYLMLVSLGLPLLWDQAVWAAWQRPSLWSRLLGVAALAALVGGSATGLAGMYWDVRLTRADFRSAVAYIQEARHPDEPVLLVSGHVHPVWRYYAPGVPYVPLPDLRVLSVEAALDLDVASALRAALGQASGAWLLLWQDEVTDPMGVVTFLLDQAGMAEERQFWHVRVRHYTSLDAAQIPAGPFPSPDAPSCQFDGGLRFLGSAPDAAGNLALFWDTLRPLDHEIRAQVTVSDSDRHVLLRSHLAPGGDSYPTSLWRPGQVTLTRYRPEAPPGVPAGTYRASVSLYDAASGSALQVLDTAGNPVGQTCAIGDVVLEGNTHGLDPSVVAARYNLSRLGGEWKGLRLVAAGACPAGALPPGTALSLPLLWQDSPSGEAAGEGGWDLHLEVSLVHSDGTVRSRDLPLSPRYPPQVWRPGEIVLDWLDWRIPADSAAGAADLRLSLADGPNDLGGAVTLCSLEVAGVSRSYTLPSPDVPSDAVAGGAIRLLGLDVDREEAPSDATLAVTLHFQALTTPEENYTLFLHLLGEDGRVWAGVDAPPDGRPTAGWLAGEVVSLAFSLQVPAQAPPGQYTYEVGWFRPELPGMPRLPMAEGGRPLPDGAVTLGRLYIR